MAEVADVRQALFTALSGITGLRVSPHPPDQVNEPCVFVGGVREQFHESFEGGSQMTADVVLLVARVEAGVSRGYAALEPYLAKSGTKSVYAALEAADGVWVTACDDSAIEYAGAVYIGATFSVGYLE